MSVPETLELPFLHYNNGTLYSEFINCVTRGCFFLNKQKFVNLQMISRLKYFQYQTNNYRYYQETFVQCVTAVSMSVQCNYTHVTVCVEQQEVYVVAEGLNVTDKATSRNVSE